MKRVGVALGGGGAKGLSHIAFLKALDELEVRPAVIAGTSIGAVIGGLYAAGMSGAGLEQLLKTIGFTELSKIILDFSILSESAIFTGKRVEEFLARRIPFQTFEELEIPLKIVATDFWNRREVIFESGSLITAIRASTRNIFFPPKADEAIATGARDNADFNEIDHESELSIGNKQNCPWW